MNNILSVFFIFIFSNFAFSSNKDWQWDSFHSIEHDSEEYSTKKAKEIADLIVLFQRETGGWGRIPVSGYQKYKRPGNGLQYDSVAGLKIDSNDFRILINENYKAFLKYDQYDAFYTVHSHYATSIDDSITTSEIRFLLRVAHVTNIAKYKKSAELGIKYLLNAQYKIGGWPQIYPNKGSYGKYITFNDNAMFNVMKVLEDVISYKFTWLSRDIVEQSREAYWKGIDYIVKAQILIDNKKTGWAQQYIDYKPAQGRIFEIPSVSTRQTNRILWLLGRVKNPSEHVLDAYINAIGWLKSVKIDGYSYEKIPNPFYPGNFSLVIKEDPLAPRSIVKQFNYKPYDWVLKPSSGKKQLWASFYDLEKNIPVFSDWTGKAYYSLSDIQYERRVNYSPWYADWSSNTIGSSWDHWKWKNSLHNKSKSYHINLTKKYSLINGIDLQYLNISKNINYNDLSLTLNYKNLVIKDKSNKYKAIVLDALENKNFKYIYYGDSKKWLINKEQKIIVVDN